MATKTKKVNISVNKVYYYTDIENYASETYEIEEFGNQEVIGRCGLILHHNQKDISLMFIMVGSNGYGMPIYKCVWIG